MVEIVLWLSLYALLLGGVVRGAWETYRAVFPKPERTPEIQKSEPEEESFCQCHTPWKFGHPVRLSVTGELVARLCPTCLEKIKPPMGDRVWVRGEIMHFPEPNDVRGHMEFLAALRKGPLNEAQRKKVYAELYRRQR